ncbi:integrin alpha [bacterium]|nr:integrin alpha [bacterium]
MATSPAWSDVGVRTYATFGESVSGAGDVNGDGYDDIIVGAGGGIFWPYAGGAYAYYSTPSGFAPNPDWSIESPRFFAFLGTDVSGAGDVNGDGYDDVIVGSVGFTNGQMGEGRVLLFLGSDQGIQSSPAMAYEGQKGYASLGGAVSQAGDVNGDGYDDVIVSAPDYKYGNAEMGLILVFHGSANFFQPPVAWFTQGEQAEASFGGSVARAGDVNGDGYDDVVVGARYFDNGDFEVGRAYLFLGSDNGLSTTPAWFFEGSFKNARFASTVDGAGDINGDGYDDVLVGAPGYKNLEPDEGAAYLFFGTVSGLESTPAWVLEGNEVGFAFGAYVSGAGDVNADGNDDVVIGSYHGGSLAKPYAFVFLGDGATLQNVPDWYADGSQAFGLGIPVADAGDTNADGAADIIIGAPYHSGKEQSSGFACLFYGVDPTATTTVPPSTTTSTTTSPTTSTTVPADDDTGDDDSTDDDASDDDALDDDAFDDDAMDYGENPDDASVDTGDPATLGDDGEDRCGGGA